MQQNTKQKKNGKKISWHGVLKTKFVFSFNFFHSSKNFIYFLFLQSRNFAIHTRNPHKLHPKKKNKCVLFSVLWTFERQTYAITIKQCVGLIVECTLIFLLDKTLTNWLHSNGWISIWLYLIQMDYI